MKEKKTLYKAMYKGATPAYFNARETIAEAMQDIERHAAENPRKRGGYVIHIGREEHGNLFSTTCERVCTAEKHGSKVIFNRGGRENV